MMKTSTNLLQMSQRLTYFSDNVINQMIRGEHDFFFYFANIKPSNNSPAIHFLFNRRVISLTEHNYNFIGFFLGAALLLQSFLVGWLRLFP